MPGMAFRVDGAASEARRSMPAQTPTRCPLLGDGVTDDVLLHIASFLVDPRDLLHLQLSCSRFATRCNASSAGGAQLEAVEMLSSPEEAARRFVGRCSEQERGCVPRRGLESFLGLMHELKALRLPPAFGRAHSSITLSENGTVATGSGNAERRRCAISMVVMRSGCHFTQFTVLAGVE